MANFIIRVELHQGNEDNYNELHQTMEQNKFLRTINDGSQTYQLPTAEYYFEGGGSDDIDNVYNTIMDIVSNLNLKYALVVTEATDMRYSLDIMDKV